MKRLLAILLAVVVIAAVSVVSPAAELVDSANGAYDAQTDIMYEVYSTYDVSVPMYIENGGQGTVSVNMNDVALGYHVQVSVTNMDENGCVPLFFNKNDPSTRNGDVKLTVNGTPYTYTNSGMLYYFDKQSADSNGDVSFTLGFQPNNSPVGAGTYDGVICFRFDCLNY